MDPLTHVLGPLLFTEPVRPPQVERAVYARWRERIAVVLGALLPDADAAPGLLGTLRLADASIYDKYHRVAFHSLPGLILAVFLAATIARKWPERWLLPTFRPKNEGLPRIDPSRWRLMAFSGVAVLFHFLGDWITAWGKLMLLWPFSERNFQLERVNSIEPVICSVTIVAWAVQNYCLSRGRRRAGWAVAGCWLCFCVAYVWIRPYYGRPAFV